MDQGTVVIAGQRAIAGEERRDIRARWSVLVFGFALILALAIGTGRASAAVPKYTCDNELGRSCTVTEELAFCVINAFNSFDDCKENGGVLNDLGCYTLYVADYYACYLTTPVNLFLR